MNPEAALEADGWGNSMIEAYTDCPARSALWMRSHPAGPEGTKSHRPQGGSHPPEGWYSLVKVSCRRRSTNVMENTRGDSQPAGQPRRGERRGAVRSNPAPKDASSKGEWQVSKVLPGSSGRGMCEEKRKMNRFSTVGTLNSGGPEGEPGDAGRHPKANHDQPIEDAIRTLRESDPPIVVRDGNAGHKPKEWAGSNASTGITSGHEYSRSNGVKLPACNGDRFWHSVPEAVPRARYPEEPGAVIPHAGICEGGTGQPVSLPQSLLK